MYVDRCRQLGFDCEAARILKGCSYPLLNDKSQVIPHVYISHPVSRAFSSCPADVNECICVVWQLQEANGRLGGEVLQLPRLGFYMRGVSFASHWFGACVRRLWSWRAY